MFEVSTVVSEVIRVSSKNLNIVINPNFGGSVSSSNKLESVLKKFDDSLELVTAPNLALRMNNARLTVDSPGEYEVADFSIQGFKNSRVNKSDSDNDNEAKIINPVDDESNNSSVVYRIEQQDTEVSGLVVSADGLAISSDVMDVIDAFDFLILPFAITDVTISGVEKLIKSLEPKVVVTLYSHGDSEAVAKLADNLGMNSESILKEGKIKAKSQSDVGSNLRIICLE